MPVAVRLIPCLDVDAGRVVKGVNFENLRDAGDPVELARTYGEQGADEITFLDVSASIQARATMLEVVAATAEQVFVPLTVGGGVRSVEDVARLLAHGADKVGVNTAAVADPDLIARVTDRFGDQVLVLSVDARRCPQGVRTESGYEVTTHGGKRSTGIDALEWACKAAELGAGEILLNSMDADGVRSGFDLEMLRAVRSQVDIPVIASGGAGAAEHFVQAALAGADAVLAASVFHFGTVSIPEVKAAMSRAGLPVRLTPACGKSEGRTHV
ncbi:imidazole glycerol phosphate synthase subunit HisF [Schaalia sp. 19OD2882]|uniref:imidazole glycerol phosphate synthase subunit HisF n=1 Tax=Schaalia sp. 19OD2882 TaxID=2794089 RepID=UPI001C1EC74C|nr:imidazole glycerol phosphate synthase subunit HisF [Schaalia sp. 19OD2882]QWW18719.1 imidazole glycerol phosphate synthase subunit HisF [Schaalia sp. 19OD2882]